MRLFLSFLFLLLSSLHAKLPMIATGNGTGYYIDAGGSLYSWGVNDQGQLGLGHHDTLLVAKRVDDSQWMWVSSQEAAVFGLKADSTLWAWGNNHRGILGLGDTLSRNKPTQVGTAKWIKVSACFSSSNGHKVPWSIGMQADSTIWTWGSNADNRYLGIANMFLGHGDSLDQWQPRQVGHKKWLDYAATYSHTIALDQDSLLWGWGGNYNGNLGEIDNPETEYYFLKPTLIDGEQKWIKVWAGDETSYLQAVDGAIWGMGANHNALYYGLQEPVLEPVFLFQNPPLEMSVAFGHYYALDSDSLLRVKIGSVWSELRERRFSLGGGRNEIGVRVKEDEWQWQTVGTSEATSAALRTDGVIYWWGNTTHPLNHPNLYVVGPVAFGSVVQFDTLPPAQIPKDSADPTGISASKPTLVAHIDARTGILHASTSAPARIFNINGKMISIVQLYQGQAQLPSLPRGLYIVRLANGQSLKWRRE